MRILRLLPVAAAAALLNGCVGLPVYTPPPGTQTADIKLSANMADDSMSMCTRDGAYLLKPRNGVVKVPADQRVHLWHAFVSGGYRVMYSCAPGISFTPDPHDAYYADFEVRAEKCSLLVYRQDPHSRTGLAFDPTIGTDRCPATTK
jgi:hypothetical protein